MNSEQKNGTCSICLEKITDENMGIRCCKCYKRFHLTCGKIDLNKYKKDSLTNWGCVSCIQNQEIKQLIRQQESKLKEIENLSNSFKNLSTEFVSLKNSIPQLIIEKMNAAVETSVSELKVVVSGVASKHTKLTLTLYSIERNDYRRDITVSGLPSTIAPPDFNNLIERIGSFHNVNFSISDVYSCFWINKKKTLLIKFNSLLIRDQLMREYYKKKSISLKDVFDCEISSRVYLNDNYPDQLRKMIIYAKKNKEAGDCKFICN